MRTQLNWYLSSLGGGEDSTPIPIGDGTHIGVYRQNDGSYKISAEIGNEMVHFGLEDISVSRMREGGAPVQLIRDGNEIKIENFDNTNTVVIKKPGRHTELSKGDQRTVSYDCAVKIGHNTELLLTSKSEKIDPEIKGDMVEKSGEKISVSAYVQVLCRHFRQTSLRATNKESDVSVGDVESCVRDLRNVVSDYSIDATGYDGIYQRLEDQIDQLELQNDNEFLSNDRVPRCKKLADDIEKLYSRS